MKLNKQPFPQLFKGIALFTPGGDLIYGIDPSKQSHWHMHLCVALQEMLGLVEPPHFLVPGYTATIDRWLDPQSLHIRTSAEIYRPVQHRQALLNAVFGTDNLVWNVAPWQEGSCDPIVLETYRHQFPQLWEDHDLIVRFERSERFSHSYSLNESYSCVQDPLLEIGIPTQQERLSIENTNQVGTPSPTPLENASFRDGVLHPKSPRRNPYRERGRLRVKRAYLEGEQRPRRGTATPNSGSLDAKVSHFLPRLRPATLTGVTDFDAPGVANASRSLKRSPTENVSSGGATGLTQTEYIGHPTANANTEDFANKDTSYSPDDSEKMDAHAQSSRTQSYVLRLFVSGNSAATEQTLKSVHQLLENTIRHPYTLKVIDVFNHPDQAEENQISATPTLLRVWPLPVRRIVGDLNDIEKVLRILAAPEA